METIKNVSISELHSFRNHPFKVETNAELCELMRSIEKLGGESMLYSYSESNNG